MELQLNTSKKCLNKNYNAELEKIKRTLNYITTKINPELKEDIIQDCFEYCFIKNKFSSGYIRKVLIGLLSKDDRNKKLEKFLIENKIDLNSLNDFERLFYGNLFIQTEGRNERKYEYLKKWRNENRERFNEWARKYNNERYQRIKNDEHFKELRRNALRRYRMKHREEVNRKQREYKRIWRARKKLELSSG